MSNFNPVHSLSQSLAPPPPRAPLPSLTLKSASEHVFDASRTANTPIRLPGYQLSHSLSGAWNIRTHEISPKAGLGAGTMHEYGGAE